MPVHVADLGGTRWEIPPWRMTWYDDFGEYHCVERGASCMDTAWPWWRPTLLEEADRD